MVSKLSAPIGWSEDEMRIVRLVSHYGHGPLPSAADQEFSSLSGSDQKQVIRLAGIIRLADVLDQTGPARRNLEVRTEANTTLILVDGFDPLAPPGFDVAAARHLLEVSAGGPILIRPAPPSPSPERALAKAADQSALL
jgi:hypothetical protein